MARQPKKTETVEFRLPYETKQALIRSCHEQGATVSETLRDLIEREILSPKSRRKPAFGDRRAIAAAVLAGLALGSVAAPSLAQQGSASDTARFEQLDHDRDGRLSLEEFKAR